MLEMSGDGDECETEGGVTRRGHRGRTDGNHGDIVDALRRSGALVLSLASLGRGVPDLLCWKAGTFVLVEVKQPKGTLTADQERFRAQGWPVRVVRSAEDAIAALKGD